MPISNTFIQAYDAIPQWLKEKNHAAHAQQKISTGVRNAAIEQVEVAAWVGNGAHGLCGFGYLRSEFRQVGPNAPKIIWAKVLPCHCVVSGPHDCQTVLNRNATLLPMAHGLKADTKDRSQLYLATHIVSSSFNWGFCLHAPHGTPFVYLVNILLK